MHRAYRLTTVAFSVLIALLGLALLVSTLAEGGGPLARGVLLGAMFVGLGLGRLALAGALRMPRRRP